MKYILVLLVVLLIPTFASARAPIYLRSFIEQSYEICKPNKGLHSIEWTDQLFTGYTTIHCNNGMQYIVR